MRGVRVTAAPVVVSDYEAHAVAEDLGIGPYWKTFKDMMVRAGAWVVGPTGETA